MESEKISNLLKQIEYYMSDENLKQDAFFHNTISASKNGFIPVKVLLNCNKIKKISTENEDLITAIKKSSELELSKNEEEFKRKNPKLPALNLLNKKNNKKDDTENTNNNVTLDKKDDEIVIFSIKTSKCLDIKWKDIQQKILEENAGLVISYLRFALDAGHLGIASKHVDKIIKKSIDTQTENKEEYTIEISKTEGDDLVDFWKTHGSHLQMCLNKDNFKNNRDKRNKKDNNQNKNKKNDKEKRGGDTKLSKPVTLGNNKFLDAKDIRQKARAILNNINEGSKALPHDSAFLEEILKYHPNKEKSKNVDYFTAGKNPDYGDSKCFFMVKTTGEKVDFSVNKCVERILEEYKL